MPGVPPHFDTDPYKLWLKQTPNLRLLHAQRVNGPLGLACCHFLPFFVGLAMVEKIRQLDTSWNTLRTPIEARLRDQLKADISGVVDL